MTIEYKWQIKQLDCKPVAERIANYVCAAHWVFAGTDGTYQGSVYGVAYFEDNIKNPNYIPFDKLTADDVVVWVQNAIGAETIGMYENIISKQIADQINPPIVSQQLPWVS